MLCRPHIDAMIEVEQVNNLEGKSVVGGRTSCMVSMELKTAAAAVIRVIERTKGGQRAVGKVYGSRWGRRSYRHSTIVSSDDRRAASCAVGMCSPSRSAKGRRTSMSSDMCRARRSSRDEL